MNMAAPRRATKTQHDWLARELTYWQSQGLIEPSAATTIRDGYEVSARFSLVKLALTLGGAFAGIGLIWLVAANLDELSPLLRIAIVVAFWLTSLAAIWWFDKRGQSTLGQVAQGIAALAFGAVVMQTAQSLQVPAYEPKLLGVWALGALMLAYAVRGMAPLIVGIGTGIGWLEWYLGQHAHSVLPVVIGILAAGVICATVATLHGRWGPRSFAIPWRIAGAALSLVGLFVAAVPNTNLDQALWTTPAIVVAVLAGIVALVGYVLSGERGLKRFESTAAGLVMALGAVLVSWRVAGGEHLSVNDWAHSALAVVAFVAAAAWFASVAIMRESNLVMVISVVSLVAFVTFQSFAVFARLIQGGWLFVVLGAIFVATGFLADRGRRELAESLQGEQS
ncbi:MAG: DUF2157 domain-containing protein [Marmoricola sp.]